MADEIKVPFNLEVQNKEKVDEATKSVQNLNDATKNAQQGLKDMADAAKNNAGGAQEAGAGASSAGMSMGMMTLAVGAATVALAAAAIAFRVTVAILKELAAVTMEVAEASVKLAMEYERSMTKVAALTNAQPQMIAQWKESLLDLASATGVVPNELAKGLYFVASAGLHGAEAMEVMTAAAKASATGMGSVEVIARTITSAVNAYGKEHLTAAHAIDVLTKTVVEGGAEATEYASSLGRVLPVAASLGVKMEEIGAFTAIFTRQGVKGQEAITALRGALLALEAPHKTAIESLREHGITVERLHAAIEQNGLRATLQDLANIYHNNAQELDKVIPNVRALTGVLAVTGAQAQEYDAALKRITESHGAADKAFEKTKESLAFQWDQVTAEFQAMGIAIGNDLIPPLKQFLDLAKQLLPVVHDLANAFGHVLGGGMQAVIDAGHGYVEFFEIAEKVTRKLGEYFPILGAALFIIDGQLKTVKDSVGTLKDGFEILFKTIVLTAVGPAGQFIIALANMGKEARETKQRLAELASTPKTPWEIDPLHPNATSERVSVPYTPGAIGNGGAHVNLQGPVGMSEAEQKAAAAAAKKAEAEQARILIQYEKELAQVKKQTAEATALETQGIAGQIEKVHVDADAMRDAVTANEHWRGANVYMAFAMNEQIKAWEDAHVKKLQAKADAQQEKEDEKQRLELIRADSDAIKMNAEAENVMAAANDKGTQSYGNQVKKIQESYEKRMENAIAVAQERMAHMQNADAIWVEYEALANLLDALGKASEKETEFAKKQAFLDKLGNISKIIGQVNDLLLGMGMNADSAFGKLVGGFAAGAKSGEAAARDYSNATSSLGKAAAIGGAAVDVFNTGKEKGMLGGAASGAMTGAMLGSVIPGVGTAAGAIVGGVVGIIGGMFKDKTAQKVMEDVGQSWGVSISKGTTDAIINTMKSLDMSKQMAELMNIDKIIEDSGRTTHEFTDQINHLMEAIANKAVPAKEGLAMLDKEFGTLATEAMNAGEVGDKALVKVIRRARELGEMTPQMKEFWNTQISLAAEGAAQIAEGLGDISNFGYANKDTPDGKKGNNQDGSDSMQFGQDAANFFVMGFQQQMESQGLLKALDSTKDSFAKMWDSLSKQGNKGALLLLQPFKDLQDKLNGADKSLRGFITTLEGEGKVFTAVANQGNLTKDGFDAMQRSIVTTQHALTAGGIQSKDALMAIHGQLAAVISASKNYGYAIDANTQSLIDQSVAAGLAFPTDPLERIIELLGDIAKGLGVDIPDSAKKAKEAIGNIPPNGSAGNPNTQEQWTPPAWTPDQPKKSARGNVVGPSIGGELHVVGEGNSTEVIAPVAAMLKHIGAAIAANNGGGQQQGMPPITVNIDGQALVKIMEKRMKIGGMRVPTSAISNAGL